MESTICLGCMQEIPLHQTVCPLCGYRADAVRFERALPLKTVLNERYIIGKDLRVSDDGITYIAYDLKLQRPRIIREYFPVQLATRGADRMQVAIHGDSLAVYKALLSDFQELYTQMMSWGAFNHVRRVCDFLMGNNTAYAVFEHLEGVTLSDYLTQHGGKLTWDQANRLFSPLLEELAMIHRSGYLHRGICPDNMVVVPGQRIVLVAFTICSANMANSIPGSGLTEGFAAPEQYEVGQHGEWTDVYGLSAVLYRVLTGVTPPYALSRRQKELLYPADYFAPDLPQHVVKGLEIGMAYDIEDRFESCTALRDGLLYGIYPNQTQPVMAGVAAKSFQDTAVTALVEEVPRKITAKPAKTQHTAPVKPTVSTQEEDKKDAKDTIFVKILLISVPIVLIIVFVIYQVLTGFGSSDLDSDDINDPTSSNSSSDAETDTEEPDEPEEPLEEPDVPTEDPDVEEPIQTYPVLKFVGDVYDDLDVTAYEAFVFTYPQYEYSETYAEGVISKQSIADGTKVEYGTTIVLTVSLGSRYVDLPDYKGYTAADYRTLLLDEYEIEAEIVREYSEEVAPKEIIRISPEVGYTYDRERKDTVKIYQSIGPDPTIEPEPDTDSDVPLPNADTTNSTEGATNTTE